MKSSLINIHRGLVILGICSMLFLSFIPSVNSQIDSINEIHAYVDWTAMINSRKTAIAGLPAHTNFPENATNWTDYAEKSVEDLLTFDASWINLTGDNIGFRPYVKGADGWGGIDWTRDTEELIATVDVIWPLLLYLRLNPNSTRQSLVDEFIASLPLYYSQVYEQATNRPGETTHDSWYYMENSVLKWGQIYILSQASFLNEPFFGSLGSAIDMAHNFNYLFPQFISVATKLQTGNTNINYGTAGLFAYSLIDAYEMTGDITYLTEAKNALEALRAVTQPYKLMYEPQEIAAGVAAAARMVQYSGVVNATTDFIQLALDLFYAGEQVLYYNDETIDWSFGFNPPASPWLPTGWLDGMHSPYANPMELGSGGINAPAAKENIEAIMFWTEYIQKMYNTADFKAVEPLKILNLNRIKHFYFFSPCIPDIYERFYGPITKQYIPYEDINYYQVRGAYDPDPLKAGYNGKEIYGAGETIWLYLMFEALGEAVDNRSLILNLNVFDQDFPSSTEDREYVVFNPYDIEKTLNFSLKHIQEEYSVYSNGTSLGDYTPGNIFSVTLPPLGSAYITLKEVEIPATTTTTEITETLTTGDSTTSTETTSSGVNGPSIGQQITVITFLSMSILVIVSVVIYAVINARKK